MNFAYSHDKLDALHQTISPGRIAPYLEASGGDLAEAIRLYELNTKLSALLYGPLQSLEVTVRNAIDFQFRTAFGEDWTSLSVIKLQPKQQADVRYALNEVATDEYGNAKHFTHDDVVAELNFGFWVGVLGPKNENEIWRKALWRAFPNRPKGVERKAVQGVLNSIRRLRNRVAHHCRIIHRDLEEDHRNMLEVIGWICPDTQSWTSSLSQFDPALLPEAEEKLPFLQPERDTLESVMAEMRTEKETRNGRRRLSIRT